MSPLEAQPEWRETTARAAYQWPAAQRDELLAFLLSRSEPSLRILASVIEHPTPIVEVRP